MPGAKACQFRGCALSGGHHNTRGCHSIYENGGSTFDMVRRTKTVLMTGDYLLGTSVKICSDKYLRVLRRSPVRE